MSTVGLLHTVPGLAAGFDQLIDAAAPGLRRIHVADAWLLDTARTAGVTDEVRATVAAHVRHLAAVGADAVLVTCSSIGEAAEQAREQVSVPVVRVDAAMADDAVALAAAPGARGRLAVLATLASTLGPTGRLVERAAAAAGAAVTVTSTVVDGAAEAAAGGDRERADTLIAQAVERAGADADAVVLAQASMAGAAGRAQIAAPVLSSPAGGVQALLAALAGTAAH